MNNKIWFIISNDPIGIMGAGVDVIGGWGWGWGSLMSLQVMATRGLICQAKYFLTPMKYDLGHLCHEW